MEKNKDDILTIRNIIIAILIILLCMSGCSAIRSYNKLKDYEKQIEKFQLHEQEFELIQDNNGKLIAQQEQVILTQKQAISNGLIAYVDLKNIQSQVRVRTVTKLDSVFIPFIKDSLVTQHDTIYIDTNQHIADLTTPKQFKISREFFNIGGHIKPFGVVLDSLNIFNQTNVSVGMKSQGFFKKPLPVVKVEHSNPYIKTVGLSNVIIKDEKKFYDRKLFWFGLGLVSGVTTTIFITK